MSEPKRALRLSASAMRDYQFCGQYYRYRRVHRITPTGKSPLYLVVGTLLHHAYYYGHADPVMTGRRLEWKLTGRPFNPERARAMFRALWEDSPGPLSALVHTSPDHFHALNADKTPWAEVHIGTGQRKATKSPDEQTRKAAWYDIYAEMLDEAVQVELPGPVKAIERRAEYALAGTDFLGYIDLVCELPDGTEAYVDIKTGMNAPPVDKLAFNPQMQLYYLDGPSVIYLWHFKSGLHRIERNTAMLSGMERSVPLMVDMIGAGIFLPRLDGECSGCVFRPQCLPEE